MVIENDRLRVELDTQEQALSQAGASGEAGGRTQQQGQQERVALLLEENALLRRENDMLLAQQVCELAA